MTFIKDARCQKCLKVLSVDSRMKIFTYLKKCKEGASITSIVKAVYLRQPTITFHINRMIEAGIVKKIKSGRQSINSVNKLCRSCPLFD